MFIVKYFFSAYIPAKKYHATHNNIYYKKSKTNSRKKINSISEIFYM